MKFQTGYNQKDFPRKYKMAGGPSMTIPDQTMSMREIMDRYARGLPLNGQKIPIYNGEEDDMPDLKNLDLADRERYMEEARMELEEVKGRINEKRRQKQMDKLKRLAKKFVQDEKEKDNEKPKPEDDSNR